MCRVPSNYLKTQSDQANTLDIQRAQHNLGLINHAQKGVGTLNDSGGPGQPLEIYMYITSYRRAIS
jgi:hypothetical protein